MKQENLLNSKVEGQARFTDWYTKFMSEWYGTSQLNMLRSQMIAVPPEIKDQIRNQNPEAYNTIMQAYSKKRK